MQHFIQVPRLSHSIALFLSLENEVGRLFKLMWMGGEGGLGGGGWLTSKGVSNQVEPFLNFPPFLYIWRNREIRRAVLKILRKILCKTDEENLRVIFCKIRTSA